MFVSPRALVASSALSAARAKPFERVWRAAALLSIVRILLGLMYLQHGLSKYVGFPAASPQNFPDLIASRALAGAIEIIGGLDADARHLHAMGRVRHVRRDGGRLFHRAESYVGQFLLPPPAVNAPTHQHPPSTPSPTPPPPSPQPTTKPTLTHQPLTPLPQPQILLPLNFAPPLTPLNYYPPPKAISSCGLLERGLQPAFSSPTPNNKHHPPHNHPTTPHTHTRPPQNNTLLYTSQPSHQSTEDRP